MKLSHLMPGHWPWFKATVAQWRYALRNTIAMCLALTFAYYLNLDEPYWAMTSAAVVSFPTVGGVISKSFGRIAGSLLGYTNEQSKVFKIVIQLAAILAVCWHFRSRIGVALGGLGSDPVQQRFAGLLIVGFLPAAVLGLLFHSTIKAHLFNPLTVAGALIAGGLLILYIERRARTPRIEQIDAMRWPDALKVGFAQAAAMFPGVSRSGATIMGGLLVATLLTVCVLPVVYAIFYNIRKS